MAFITIIQTKSGHADCSDYFFRAGTPNRVCRIFPGEIAYVPDEEVERHLATKLVTSVDGRSAKGKIVNPEDLPAK